MCKKDFSERRKAIFRAGGERQGPGWCYSEGSQERTSGGKRRTSSLIEKGRSRSLAFRGWGKPLQVTWGWGEGPLTLGKKQERKGVVSGRRLLRKQLLIGKSITEKIEGKKYLRMGASIKRRKESIKTCRRR